ncbi:hypothetical protein [[Pseudomonas] boreopolis]|uniref:hypothetical protein n=1 Tax=Xanthomonas boreopolis TaxID=86183 RepID=UPI003D9B2973
MQQIVELCDIALETLRKQDTYREARPPYPTTAMNDIARTLLDKGSLTQEVRKVIAIKDQGPLTTAAIQLSVDSWQNGRAYEQHSGRVFAVQKILQSNIDRLSAQTSATPHVVFYSWQSDLDSRFNRNFIEESIERAIKNVAEDGQVVPRIDQGAQGTAGSQSLHATILRKIESCGVFIADVSLVNGPGGRHCNSNVMYELGYATRCLGEDRVLLICNTAKGEIEDLPFDIKHKYVLAYRLSDGDEKAPVRNRLAAMIEDKVRPIFKK